MSRPTNPLISSSCLPLAEFKSLPLYDELVEMGYLEADEDPENIFVVVADIFSSALVCTVGFVNPETKTIRLQFIIPMKDIIPKFDFGSLLLKHFPGYSLHYSPGAEMDDFYVEFLANIGFTITHVTYVSGNEECPEPSEGSAVLLSDMEYLDKERLRTTLRFQSLYPEDDPKTKAYYNSIDQMFSAAEEYPHISAVAMRDGKPAGFAVIEQVNDERTYRLAFHTMFPGHEHSCVLADMINLLTWWMEKFGCSITLNVGSQTTVDIAALTAMGFTPYTNNFERR